MRYLFFTFTVLCFSFGSRAQTSFTETVNGSFYVSSVQSLVLTGGSFVPGFNSIDDFANGISVSNYLSIGIKSNVSWNLSVQANNIFFTSLSQGGSTNMPASVLKLKLASSSGYIPLSTTPQTLKTGNKGNTTAPGNSFYLDIKYEPGFNYKGGIYAIGLIYTLSRQ